MSSPLAVLLKVIKWWKIVSADLKSEIQITSVITKKWHSRYRIFIDLPNPASSFTVINSIVTTLPYFCFNVCIGTFEEKMGQTKVRKVS